MFVVAIQMSGLIGQDEWRAVVVACIVVLVLLIGPPVIRHYFPRLSVSITAPPFWGALRNRIGHLETDSMPKERADHEPESPSYETMASLRAKHLRPGQRKAVITHHSTVKGTKWENNEFIDMSPDQPLYEAFDTVEDERWIDNKVRYRIDGGDAKPPAEPEEAPPEKAEPVSAPRRRSFSVPRVPWHKNDS